MADPFQDVDAAGRDFADFVTEVLDRRAAEPAVRGIIDGYLAQMAFGPETLTVEVGCGSGAVTRLVADQAGGGRVIGTDLSQALIDTAQARFADVPGLSFQAVDGGALPFDDHSVDNVILHTVLSHVPDPAAILAEACRVLKPGGRVAICDVDFEKTALRNDVNDPLDICARAFVTHFVTDAHLAGKLRGMSLALGLVIEHFDLKGRTITEGLGAYTWVKLGGDKLVELGVISQALADALLAEHDRRAAAGTLFAFQPFAVLVARKPG